MVCRTTRIGSAVTSHARLSSGLQDVQALSTFHELIREGRQQQPPTAEQVNAFVDAQVSSVRADTTLTEARRRSLVDRLQQARTQQIDGRTFYAAQHLQQRTVRARAALDTYCDQVARERGVSRAQVEGEIAGHIRDAEQGGRNRTADGPWREAFSARPENVHLPMDRQTAYALQQIEAAREQARSQARTRTAVTRRRVIGSSAIASVGYDESSGRLEVEMHSRPGHAYAYRIPPSVHADLMAAPSMGHFYSTRIRRNADYQYPTAEDAAAAATQRQCPTCGQWASAGHTCPVRDSAEERNRTERLARERARAAVGQPTPERPVALGADTSTRTYNAHHGSFRTPLLTTVRQEVARQGAVRIPLTATLTSTAETAPTDTRTRDVTGTVVVDRVDGQWRVMPGVEPGDSGQERLRCTCSQYRSEYTCPHVRQAVADVQTRLNQDRLAERHLMNRASEEVAAALAVEQAESVAAQTLSASQWGQGEVSYTEDPAAFQAAYQAAKDRQAAGEAAIPYMTENATDGLGARGTGRAFGVEIEFDIPSGVDRSTALRAIGRDLHAAGLTRSANQSYYHSAESRGYTENHQGGWSYEDDCTVSGEIVSPIMYDEPETWRNLQTVCDIVKRHGGVATARTGAHVHVSAHNYDHTVENHSRMMATFRENEDVIYRLSSSPDRGTHRGPQWCAPNRVPADGYQNVSQARSANFGHNLGINMQSVNGRQSDHIEFRTWDGTLDPAVMQTQVKVSLGITEAAFRDRDRPMTPGAAEPLGSHRAHNRAEHGSRRRLTGDAWRQDTASFRSLADRIFRRAADKEQATALFALTKWQRGTR